MLPTCTGLQTFDTEEAITGSASSNAPNTSHDLEIQKFMDIHVPALSSKQPVNKNATYVVKSYSPSKIVDDMGCVSSLKLSSGNENQYVTITNATATNDNENCIENAATTAINRKVCGPIDDDAVACHASHLESTSTRALAAKSVNSMTMANLSDYLNKQCISNDDTTSDMTATTSSNDTSSDASERTHLPPKTISHLQDGQNKIIE